MQDELGPKGLAVIMMESQGSKAEELPAFMMKKFPHNTAAAVVPNNGLRIGTSLGGIPKCAIVGVDGTLLVFGHNSKLGSKVEELIMQELTKRKRGWGDDKQIRKARALMHGKGDLGGAWKILDGLQVDAEQEADLAAAKAELQIRYEVLEKSITYYQEQGQWREAQGRMKALAKAAKGVAEWKAAIETLEATFKTADAKKELSLAKKLDRMLRPLADKGPKDGDDRRFEQFAKKNEGTTVGSRAARLAAAIRGA